MVGAEVLALGRTAEHSGAERSTKTAGRKLSVSVLPAPHRASEANRGRGHAGSQERGGGKSAPTRRGGGLRLPFASRELSATHRLRPPRNELHRRTHQPHGDSADRIPDLG